MVIVIDVEALTIAKSKTLELRHWEPSTKYQSLVFQENNLSFVLTLHRYNRRIHIEEFTNVGWQL